MRRIRVPTASAAYDVEIATGLLARVGPAARAASGGARTFILADDNVGALYAEPVKRSLADEGYLVTTGSMPADESHKNMARLARVLEEMAETGIARGDTVVALGGGVVGDLAGFAAAVYMRGCQIVQVPTTLLAMVDSSVGDKNLAGAFLQPRAVIGSLECLASVTLEQLSDSCGEVLKYGVLADATLWRELVAAPLNMGALDFERLERVVARCIEIKRDIVGADERERGVRQTLNLGRA